jgi:hypothetical protein
LSSKSNESIVFKKSCVDKVGECRGEGLLAGCVDKVDNGTLEENSENVSEITKPVSTDVKSDVVSVNINNDVHGVNHHELAAIRSNLGVELETKSNLHFVHVHFNVALSNHERGDLVAEFSACELSCKLIASQSNCIVCNIGGEHDIVNTLFDVKVVVLHVIAIFRFEIRDGKSV